MINMLNPTIAMIDVKEIELTPGVPPCYPA